MLINMVAKLMILSVLMVVQINGMTQISEKINIPLLHIDIHINR